MGSINQQTAHTYTAGSTIRYWISRYWSHSTTVLYSSVCLRQTGVRLGTVTDDQAVLKFVPNWPHPSALAEITTTRTRHHTYRWKKQTSLASGRSNHHRSRSPVDTVRGLWVASWLAITSGLVVLSRCRVLSRSEKTILRVNVSCAREGSFWEVSHFCS